MKLPQILISDSLLLYSHLIPIPQDILLTLFEVEKPTHLFLNYQDHFINLPSLNLGEKKQLIGTLNKLLLLRPLYRDYPDFLKYFLVF